MTVAVNTDQRYAVWFRPRGGRWAIAGTAGSHAAASDLLFDLMAGGGSGDWLVSPADQPPGQRRPAAPADVN